MDRRTVGALVAFAKNSKLLSLVDRMGLVRLAERSVIQDARTGDVIVTQGEVGETFYLIAEGEVSVRVRDASPNEVARLGAGMFFGEIAVVTREPRSATVVALAPTRLLAFPREPLMELIQDYPRLREVLGTVGLARAEENLRRRASSPDQGLAEALEGEEEPLTDAVARAPESEEGEDFGVVEVDLGDEKR